MQVFKFGGASVKDAEAIKNVGKILSNYQEEKLVVVISAMGKTTNALEAITDAYYHKKEELNSLFETLQIQHYAIVKELFEDENHPVKSDLDRVLNAVKDWFGMPPTANYNFIYDQIVSSGELLSTLLVAAWLNHQGIKAEWVDVRSILETDNSYREGSVNWERSTAKIQAAIPPKLEDQIVVTQGFLGGTIENFTTTLGREGSDYSAAIFSNILDAERMSVWKDVPGILSGDPRIVEDPELIHQLSYYEAIEMTYYGAKVIHPKTIKPLQNKNIPLAVRSFKDPKKEGTIIHDKVQENMPAVVVFNKNQVQIYFYTKDYSFIAEENLSMIYSALAKHRIRTNLSQNGSISFRVCTDNVPYKIEPLIKELEADFEIMVEDGLELVTVRHYNDAAIAKYTNGREVLLSQKGRENIQLVVK